MCMFMSIVDRKRKDICSSIEDLKSELFSDSVLLFQSPKWMLIWLGVVIIFVWVNMELVPKHFTCTFVHVS